jgi:hypothetical protein
MFNPRLSGIFAGAGFVLSFLVGVLSGALFPLILIRALIFAAIFFALSGAGYGAIQLYLPELLPRNSGDIPPLGGQVDISVGDDDSASGDISFETGSMGDDLNEFIENPGDSGADTLDQMSEDIYTEKGDIGETQVSSKPALPDDPAFFSEETDSVDMLPDLDSMSGALNSGAARGGGESSGVSSPASSLGGQGALSGRAQKKGLDEDFNVQEMASAIQTILKRENKG